ncbi:MAG: gamma-glutamylcyclotransferase [Paracoccaceae bacterium]
MTAEALFLYGTLRDARVYAAVAGEPLQGQPARLEGHAVAEAVGDNGTGLGFPLFTPRAGAVAEGLIVTPSPDARARLDTYERIFGYDPQPVRVETDAGTRDAVIYVPQAGRWQARGDWDLAAWSADRGALAAEIATDVILLARTHPPARIYERYRMLEAAATSRHRALAEPAPATLRRAPAAQDVDLVERRLPYARYFGVDESDLRFRRFDGSQSETVTRAAFIMADAVTVLPYDPVRDTVMLVEQFRFGPLVRGAQNCWSLEPIAGRIDAHESPETAARRESLEEARLTLAALHPCGRYYVSPGAVSEYMISYVGIADPPDTAQGVSGLEIEAEDIRAHVIPFERLMELVESGEAETAPLVISAQWLALNRARLRAQS